MKRIILISLLLIWQGISVAQPPENYYGSTDEKYGEELLIELHNIIKVHTELTYSALWTAFYQTDVREDGMVWDMYSTCDFTFGDDQDAGSGGTVECDRYNREHSFPNSWWGGSTSAAMYTDLFHLYPTDKKVNSVRANYPFGEVSNASYTSSNGSKLGTSSYSGYNGTVFEPIDQYKGDFARTYFYMATRYYDVMHTWSFTVGNNTQFPAYEEWVVNMLLEWHELDPVSEKEINRNNIIFDDYQHNRNPFIDHPEFAARIWVDNANSSTIQHQQTIRVYPNPASSKIIISGISGEMVELSIHNVIGQRVKTFVSISGEFSREVQINDLPNGVYLVRVKGVGFGQTVRLVVSR